VKAMAGCKSDKVAGICNVGEKTAIKYLNGNLKSTTKAYKDIKDSKDLIESNMKLVDLPMEGTGKFRLNKDRMDLPAFMKLCEDYGFQSFLRDIWEWKHYVF